MDIGSITLNTPELRDISADEAVDQTAKAVKLKIEYSSMNGVRISTEELARVEKCDGQIRKKVRSPEEGKTDRNSMPAQSLVHPKSRKSPRL
jgi:hypothetical protein